MHALNVVASRCAGHWAAKPSSWAISIPVASPLFGPSNGCPSRLRGRCVDGGGRTLARCHALSDQQQAFTSSSLASSKIDGEATSGMGKCPIPISN